MTPLREDPEALEVDLFLQGIHSRYGYDLREYASASMARRVRAVLAKTGYAHLGELQHQVLKDPNVFHAVLQDLTVHVTEMFRDPSAYRAFRQYVVPVLRTYPLLKVWHCGCASGEEAYATTILLTEEGLIDRTQVYATDISTDVLAQARAGTYAATLLPTFSENYRLAGGLGSFSNYITEAYDGFAIKEALRKHVVFFQHDVVTDYSPGEMHVLFCRNVLIYFNKALRERIVRSFTQSLVPGGFLCLGSAERLSGYPSFSEFVAQERIYRHER